MICTDGEASVTRLARENVARAGQQCNANSISLTDVIEVQQYWWGSGPIPGTENNISNDNVVVLVSDCVLPKLYPIALLVIALDQLLVHPNALGILHKQK